MGTQYRSVVFYETEEEHKIASEAIAEEQRRLGRKVATTLEGGAKFYAAEEYHQDYLLKGGQSATKGALDPIRCYG